MSTVFMWYRIVSGRGNTITSVKRVKRLESFLPIRRNDTFAKRQSFRKNEDPRICGKRSNIQRSKEVKLTKYFYPLKLMTVLTVFLYDPLFFGIFYSTFSLSIICRSSKTDQVKPKVRFKGGFSACFLFGVYNIYLQKLKILCSWQFKGCFSSVSF